MLLILHWLNLLFSVFHVFQALSIFCFILVTELYIGDPYWKQIKHRKYSYSSKALLMNTLNSGIVNPLPSSMFRSYKRIPQSKSYKREMHIMLRGHIETDPFTSSYFVTFSLEYPKTLCLICILVSNWPFRFQKQAVFSSVVRFLICLFIFISKPKSKVYKHRSRCQTGEILAHLNNVKCTFSRECHMFHNTRWLPVVNNLKT